ncbi:MAG: methyl-accepting chemotaxis protein, partial [Oscillospiraceae bacterium]
KMTARTVGSGEYTYNGVVKIAGYAPVQNTPWIVVFGVEKNEIMSGANSLQRLLLAVFVVVGLIGVLVIFFVSSGISKLINKVTAAAQEIAQGNFDVTLLVKSKDEVGLLADAFNLTLQRLINYQEYIDEISGALQSISQGDLAIALEKEYTGQFEKIKSSMDALLENLNTTLLQILQASDQVSSSSGQVASGAQALAQGATEQASSIQELSASIAYVTEQIEQNAENSKLVISKAELAGQELQQSDAQMKDMIEAMQQINSKASEISKIIKIIDDIAFQTNILALNAAVEAARAGTAGKGFAVVADEVRNLAAKSAEAAKSTSDLIEQTIETVDNGSSIADRTAHSLSKSAEETLSVISFIDRIAKASQDQATAIAQINQGVDQVSSVVQINAATAEESAAASEELSGQSSVLRELISNFNLRGTASADTYL